MLLLAVLLPLMPEPREGSLHSSAAPPSGSHRVFTMPEIESEPSPDVTLPLSTISSWRQKQYAMTGFEQPPLKKYVCSGIVFLNTMRRPRCGTRLLSENSTRARVEL